MNSKNTVQSVADIAAGIVLASVEIDASPDRVFQALTTPKELIQWWGSDEIYRMTAWNADLHVGGGWQALGRQADKTLFKVEGLFLSIEAPHKLVYTWKADWDEGRSTTLTYRLEAMKERTRVTVRHEGFKAMPESCRSYAEGWKLVLGWLERHFAPQAAAQPRFFLFRFIPPRASFPKDITAQEGAVMQQHFGYWANLTQSGTVIVYGPVDDPKGTWGIAIVRVADEQAARLLTSNDPAIQAGLGFCYDVFPMAQALVGT